MYVYLNNFIIVNDFLYLNSDFLVLMCDWAPGPIQTNCAYHALVDKKSKDKNKENVSWWKKKKDLISNTRHLSKDELKRIANDKGIKVLYEYSVEKEGWMSNLQGGCWNDNFKVLHWKNKKPSTIVWGKTSRAILKKYIIYNMMSYVRIFVILSVDEGLTEIVWLYFYLYRTVLISTSIFWMAGESNQ